MSSFTGSDVVCLTPNARLSEKETDLRDKLTPSVNYLQRLGPEYLELIFKHSRWVFEEDHDIAFEVRCLYSQFDAYLRMNAVFVDIHLRRGRAATDTRS